jgi:integrase
MNTVIPIKSKEAIVKIKNNLRAEPRNYLMFVMGINSALRISDILPLKVKDVLDSNGDIRRHIYLRQKKTGKELSPAVNEAMAEAIKFYFDKMPKMSPDDYLFSSPLSKGKPIDKVRAWQLVQKWTKEAGLLEGRYGTHSLRKTWGYQARQAGMPLELISEKLGHQSTVVTRRYIGISADEVNGWENKLNL